MPRCGNEPLASNLVFRGLRNWNFGAEQPVACLKAIHLHFGSSAIQGKGIAIHEMEFLFQLIRALRGARCEQQAGLVALPKVPFDAEQILDPHP